MARLINGGEFGEMRGSLGNNVFTKTAAGAIMRRRAIPVNRNSAGQIQARGSFSTIQQRWTNLNPDFKAAWESYAQNGFSPAKYSHTVAVGSSHRGRQAFISLNSVISAAAAVTTPAADANMMISLSNHYPVYNAMESGDEPPPSGYGKPDGIAGAQISFLPSGGSFDVSTQQIVLLMSNTTEFNVAAGGGVLIYSSERLPYVGARPRSPKLILLAAVQPFSSMSSALPAGVGQDIEFYIDSQYQPDRHVQPLQVAEKRMFTIYGYDVYGQVSKLGSQYFDVDA